MLAQRAAFHAVRLLGVHAIPGRTSRWAPPVDAETWSELANRWQTELGTFDALAVHLRRPADRAGMSLLLIDDGNPLAFVKLRPERSEGLERERRAVNALQEVAQVTVPSVRAFGTVGTWHYQALSALPGRVHSVAFDPPVREVVDEVSTALGQALVRPPEAQVQWLPMHGDFTPWNLRTLADGRLVLFDWEDVAWAPPLADLLWYDAVVSEKRLRVRPSGVVHDDAVIDYWIDRLGDAVRPADTNLAARIYRALEVGWRP